MCNTLCIVYEIFYIESVNQWVHNHKSIEIDIIIKVERSIFYALKKTQKGNWLRGVDLMKLSRTKQHKPKKSGV